MYFSALKILTDINKMILSSEILFVRNLRKHRSNIYWEPTTCQAPCKMFYRICSYNLHSYPVFSQMMKVRFGEAKGLAQSSIAYEEQHWDFKALL